MYALEERKQDGIVVAVPGANCFSKEWVDWFFGFDVVCCYDNDDAGREGTKRVFKMLGGKTKSLAFIHWPEGLKDGYDVHDLVKENLDDLELVFTCLATNAKPLPPGVTDARELNKNLPPPDTRETEQLKMEPMGAEELHATFAKWLTLDNYDQIDVTMAVMWSTFLPGNPLWMFIVAPPSGSKSETIMPVSAWFRCYPISNMTSKSLVSGFPGPGGTDPSLLASMDNRLTALAIKDLTPLLQGRDEERDEVFGILRDAYDGSLVKVFGNGLRREYKALHFSIVAGVTPVIDLMSNTALGERFLKFRSDRDLDRADDIDRAMRAIQNCGNEVAMRQELRDACVRSLVRPFALENVRFPSSGFSRLVAQLAYVVAKLRAVAPTERGSDQQTMAPMSEAPPRLATQLVKFSQGLALHLEAQTLDDPRVRRLVRRVSLHTVDTMTAAIVQVLYFIRPVNGMDSKTIGTFLPTYGQETLAIILRRLTRTRVVSVAKVDSHTHFRLSDDFRVILDETKMYDGLPKSDIHYRRDLYTTKAKLVLRRRGG